MSETKDVREVAFQQWWRWSKYCQVVFPKDGREQIARDGFNAAWNRRVTLEPAPKPAGGEWVLVPREPTEAMMSVIGGTTLQAKIWKAMLSAAPPSPAASPSGGEVVVVKALDWRRGYCDDQVIIEQASFGGLYQVRQFDGDIWLDHLSASSSKHETVGAAKAAAQADFEQRICSALTSPEAPQASEVVRELVAALDLLVQATDDMAIATNCGSADEALSVARPVLAAYKRSTTDGQ